MSPSTHPPLPPRSADEQARLDAEVIDLIEVRTPFQQALGVKVRALRPSLVLGFDWRPDLVGHFHSGRLHGGVISAVLDALAGCALMSAIADKYPHESADQILHRTTRLGTIDMRIDFLRPGLGKHFVGSCEITRLGGRVASTVMRLHNDEGLLIATGAASYVVS